jgi:hypothetical protein
VSFQLVYGDQEFVLQLAFEPDIEDRLVNLIDQTGLSGEARAELSKRFVESISALVESNVAPPTEKQLKYAVAIARELSLQLSPEVLRFRDAMTSFLNMHAETYRKRKNSIS